MAAIAGMAPRVEAAAPGGALRQRFISAAVLLPIAFGAAWLGGGGWALLVGIFAMAMAWEWSGVCGGQTLTNPFRAAIAPAGLAAMIAVACAVGLAAASIPLAMGALALGAIAAAVLASGGRRGSRPGWQALGVAYVGLPSIAIVWIRAQPGDGLAVLAWMLSLVIAVDTGAYVAGRLIGGPKLAPRISPKKTWAGLGGGIAGALLIGSVAAFLLELPRALPLVLASGGLAVVEQAGDLAESAFKRRFGVKDSSQLIPGHGGVLDRVDGLLAVSIAVGAAGYYLGGFAEWMR
jgi:phosphatidate cytidylyltransferase